MVWLDLFFGVVSWGSYFDHALTWEKKMDDPNVMIITYEDMKQVDPKDLTDVLM